MRAPLPPRALRFQSLETRDLLAGNVVVENRNGSLFVIGDSLDNVLTIERVLSPTGVASLLVSPDATTSINGLAVGQALSLADFNKDGNLDLGAGSDSVTLLGHYFDDQIFSKSNTSLRVKTGAGDDHIEIDSWSWGTSMVIGGDWNNDGTDTVGLYRVRAGLLGTGPAATALSLSDCTATVNDSDFLGVVSATSKVFAKVEIHNSRASSLSLSDVEGTVTDSDFTGAMVAKGKVFAKVEINRCSASSLTLTNTDVTVTESDFTGAMRYSCNGKHIGNVIIELCTASSLSVVQRGEGLVFSASNSRFFDVSVSGDSGTAAAPLQFVSTVTMTDCVVTSKLTALTLTNVDSSLTDCKFTGAISSKSAGGWDLKKMEGLRVSASSLTLSNVDGTLDVVDIGGTMSATASEKQHYTIKLTNANISRLSVSQLSGPLDFSATECTFFDVFADVAASPSSAGQIVLSSFSFIDDDCDGAVTLRSVGAIDVTVDGSSATDMFMKFYRPTNSAQAPNSKVSLSDLNITRRLSIEDRGGLDVTSNACAAVDFFLKLDGIKGEVSHSSLSIVDGDISHLSLRSTQACDVDLEQSEFFDVFCDIAQVASPGVPASTLQIKMSDLLVSSACSVSTRGGSADVDVGASRFASWFMKIEGVDGSSAVTQASLHQVTVATTLTVIARDQSEITLDTCTAKDIGLYISKVSKASPLLAQAVCNNTAATGRFSIESVGGIDVSLAACSAVDMFLKLDGIKGELYRSTTSIVECQATKLSVVSTVTADAYLDADSDGDTVDEDCDLALTGGSFFDVFLDVTRTATSPPGAPPAAFMKVKMSDLLVSGFSSVSTKGGTTEADISSSKFEICSFSFGSSNAGSNAAGGGLGSGKVSVHDISVTKSASLSVSGLYDVDVSSLAAVDMFLKLERTSVSQQISTLLCADVDLDGRMSIDSNSALDVSLDACASSDMFLKIGSIKGELSRSSVSVSGSSASSKLSITSLGTCDVSLDSSRFFDVFVDLTRSASPPNSPYMQIKLEEVLVSGFCTVSTKGGPVDAEIGNSSFEICSWSFGASNPTTVGSGGGGGAGKVSVHDISVTKSASLSMSGLYDVDVSSLSAVDFFLKLERTAVSQQRSSVDLDNLNLSGAMSLQSIGAVDATYQLCYSVDNSIWFGGIKGELQRSSVSISDSSVSSKLSLTSLVTCDVSLVHSSFFDVATNVTRSALPPGSSLMKYKMENVFVSGFCTVSSQGETDADISSSGFEKSFSFSWGATQQGAGGLGSGGGAGKVSMSDVSVRSSLSLSSRGQTDITAVGCTATDIFMKVDRLSRLDRNASVSMQTCSTTGRLSIEGRGGVDVSVDGGSFASIYMKLDSVKGELHRQAISLDNVSGGSLRCVSTETQDFSLSHASLTDLFYDVTLPTSPTSPVAMEIELSNILVSGLCSVSTRGGVSNVDVTSAQCGDSLAMTFAGGGGGGSGKVNVHDISVTKVMSLSTRGENDVTVDACTTGAMSIKFERLSTGQPGASSCILGADGALTVQGTLSIESRGSLDVSAFACRAVDMFLKIEGVSGERRTSNVELVECVVDGQMSVTSGPTEMTISGCVADDIITKLSSNSSNDGSRVLVTSTDCDDRFSLTTSSGNDVAVLDDVTTNGRAFVSQGAGDDSLSLLNCAFDQSSFFDGGLGFDHLTVDEVFEAAFHRHNGYDVKTIKTV